MTMDLWCITREMPLPPLAVVQPSYPCWTALLFSDSVFAWVRSISWKSNGTTAVFRHRPIPVWRRLHLKQRFQLPVLFEMLFYHHRWCLPFGFSLCYRSRAVLFHRRLFCKFFFFHKHAHVLVFSTLIFLLLFLWELMRIQQAEKDMTKLEETSCRVDSNDTLCNRTSVQECLRKHLKYLHTQSNCHISKAPSYRDESMDVLRLCSSLPADICSSRTDCRGELSIEFQSDDQSNSILAERTTFESRANGFVAFIINMHLISPLVLSSGGHYQGDMVLPPKSSEVRRCLCRRQW